MKTLVILRHSKTEPSNPAGDWTRELTQTGIHRAREAGRQIRQAIGKPDLIVTSDAVRAVRTAALLAESIHFTDETLTRSELYAARENDVIDVIQELPDDFQRVIVVGHNPAFEMLANRFRESGMNQHLRPAGWIAIELPIDKWGDFQVGSGTIRASGEPDN